MLNRQIRTKIDYVCGNTVSDKRCLYKKGITKGINSRLTIL